MKSVDNIKNLIKKASALPSAEMNSRTLKDIFEAQEESKRRTSAIFETNIFSIIFGRAALYLVVVFLIVFSLVTSFVLSRKNSDLKDELELAQRDVAATPIDDSVTINFYLKEHQDFIARQASLNSAVSQPIQMQINQDDIMYYEFLDDELKFMHPGIIVRGPSFEREVNLPETPVISNDHTLILSEARQAADFELVSPSWFRPCYILDQIRRIEDRDTLQLLYTDGINSVSLFEQPLDGQRGLSHQDFREYAVYNNQEEGGGTILAWRDNALSYVLIGNVEMSQLMDMAQSINTRK